MSDPFKSSEGNKRPKLFVHVGDIKSATTSIQVALLAGLAPKGTSKIIYPGKTTNHNGLEKCFLAPRPKQTPLVRKVSQDIRQGAIDDIYILSGERLSTLNPIRLQNALNRCFSNFTQSIEIIHYVRPQLDRMLSSYAEMIKIGLTAAPLTNFITESLTRHRYIQQARLENWRATFAGNYKLRAMLKKTMRDSDPVSDFFETVLGSLPPDWRSPKPNNESLSAQGLAEVARFQKTITNLPHSARHALGYEFAYRYSKACADISQPKHGITAAHAPPIFEALHADALALDQMFSHPMPYFEQALLEGLEKAKKGISEPLDLEPDQFGADISTQLHATITQEPDIFTYAKRLRRERFSRDVEAARQSVTFHDA